MTRSLGMMSRDVPVFLGPPDKYPRRGRYRSVTTTRRALWSWTAARRSATWPSTASALSPPCSSAWWRCWWSTSSPPRMAARECRTGEEGGLVGVNGLRSRLLYYKGLLSREIGPPPWRHTGKSFTATEWGFKIGYFPNIYGDFCTFSCLLLDTGDLIFQWSNSYRCGMYTFFRPI